MPGAAMSHERRKSRLEQLRFERDAKFDEIVSCLSRELYSESSVSEEDRNSLIEEAEILTDNWAAAENNHRPLVLSTALQILLSEHQAICKQIIEILDSGRSEEY
jgi:hypothetical protein